MTRYSSHADAQPPRMTKNEIGTIVVESAILVYWELGAERSKRGMHNHFFER